MKSLRSEQILDAMISSKTKYRTIIQAGIAKWVKDFQEGKIIIDEVDDLKKLVELDISLQKDDYSMARNLESLKK